MILKEKKNEIVQKLTHSRDSSGIALTEQMNAISS
jgi:hypothetical protein